MDRGKQKDNALFFAYLAAGWLALSAQAAGGDVGRASPDNVGGARGPLIAPAVIDESLEVTGKALRARERNKRMTIGVSINGQGPYEFLIDSGADRSVVGALLAQRLQLPVSDTATLHDMAGESLVTTVRVNTLRAGTNEVNNLRMPVLAEANLGAQGIMGIDALREQRILMDFEKRTVTLQDARRAERQSDDPNEIIVTARRQKGQLILTELRISGLSLSAVIDTGAQVTLGNSALFRKLFARKRSPRLTSLEVISVTGKSIHAQVATVSEMTLGSLILRDVPVAFVDVPPFELFGLADEPAVLLGSDVLESFRRISLDFRNRRVRFVLKS